jgi:hypothetical protein
MSIISSIDSQSARPSTPILLHSRDVLRIRRGAKQGRCQRSPPAVTVSPVAATGFPQ